MLSDLINSKTNNKMAIEIERKFLVLGDFKKEVVSSHRIRQAYISRIAERTVRIRIKDEQGFITIKGKSNETGTSRFEWEKGISKEEAEALLELCEEGMIDKTRYVVNSGSHVFEVDEFYGLHQGLVLAEIELKSEEESFIKPKWLGKEVTGDPRYYNSQM